MRDITVIDWTQPYSKRVQHDTSKQKVFFIQDGIEYGSDGKACNKTQINAYLKRKQDEAQAEVDAAKAALDAAKANAADLKKTAGK